MGKVLARRANGIFIVAPIAVVALCAVMWVDIIYNGFEDLRLLFYCSVDVIFFSIIFIDRLFKPRVMAVYDEWGITLKKNRFSSVYITKREAITAVPIEDEAEATVYVSYGFAFFKFTVTHYTFGFLKTGTIQIHTKNGRYKISDVDNVMNAAHEINVLLRRWRDEYEAEITKNIEKQREAEEKAFLEEMKKRIET